MNPGIWKALVDAKIKRDKNLTEIDMSRRQMNLSVINVKSVFVYYQCNRSADEPMTTFITCLNCGNKWKI